MYYFNFYFFKLTGINDNTFYLLIAVIKTHTHTHTHTKHFEIFGNALTYYSSRQVRGTPTAYFFSDEKLAIFL